MTIEFLQPYRETLVFMGMGFMSLFTTLNPMGGIAFFLSQTESNNSDLFRKQVAKKTAIAICIILCLFGIIGHAAFSVMGITIDSFRIAGGIFVFGTAMDMLRGAHVRARTLPEEREQAADKDDFAIIPLAIPLLAGPGSIAIAIIAMDNAKNNLQAFLVIVNIFAVSFLTYLIFRSSVKLLHFLGESGVRVLNRIMGLFLASIAVEMFVAGVKSALQLGS